MPLWVITGAPGVGKTTVVAKMVRALRARGASVGGVISGEAREGPRRTGFTLTDLATGVVGTLATSAGGVGPRLGKYVVNLKDLAEIGAPAISRAVAEMDVIVLDEVGPMEIFSPEFIRAAEAAFESEKPIVAVVHARSKHPLAERLRNHPEARLIDVTIENRERLSEALAEEVFNAITVK